MLKRERESKNRRTTRDGIVILVLRGEEKKRSEKKRMREREKKKKKNKIERDGAEEQETHVCRCKASNVHHLQLSLDLVCQALRLPEVCLERLAEFHEQNGSLNFESALRVSHLFSSIPIDSP